MDLSTRQEGILDLLRQRGAVDVDALAQRFSVSTQTIRNDLRDLSDRGLAARTHGGARSVASASNREYAERRVLRRAAKEAMGRRAAELIPPDCSVMLNIGTSTEQVAHALKDRPGIVVLSNNINIINTLIGSQAKELILVGGSVRPSDGAIVGGDAVEFISRYKVDYAVLGASAIDSDGAILDYDAREVEVSRAILRNSRVRILVADGSKFDQSAPVRICDVADIDHFVTDDRPPAAFAEAARRGQTEILTLEKSDGPRIRSA